MKRICRYLLPLLFLLPLAGAPLSAENLNKARLNALIQEVRGDEHVEIVNIGSFGMKMIRTAARAAAKTPEDREAVRFLKDLTGIKIVNFEGMADRERLRFAARVEKALAGQDQLLEVKGDGEQVRIYASADEKKDGIRDMILFDGKGNLICLFGTVPFELVEKMVAEKK